MHCDVNKLFKIDLSHLRYILLEVSVTAALAAETRKHSILLMPNALSLGVRASQLLLKLIGAGLQKPD